MYLKQIRIANIYVGFTLKVVNTNYIEYVPLNRDKNLKIKFD